MLHSLLISASLVALTVSHFNPPESWKDIAAKQSTGDLEKTIESLQRMLLLKGRFDASSLDPDSKKEIQGLVEEKGYPLEEHFVTTEDGYILGVFRIPFSRKESRGALNSGKPVVFLQHGLEDSSFTWVNNFENESLAYILSDNGYDVWMGNNRGNYFSQAHVTYTARSAEFWNFTFQNFFLAFLRTLALLKKKNPLVTKKKKRYDEMGKYDTYAQINYVLEYVNQSKLAYVGHSEGTTQFFAMATSRHELQSKIAICYFFVVCLFACLLVVVVDSIGGLAPVAYVGNCKSLVIDLLAALELDKIFELFGVRQFLPGQINRMITHVFAPPICHTTPEVCNLISEELFGPSKDLNVSRYEVYYSEAPSDTSVKNIAHW
ncbi:carboxylic ester hydrolase [Reticulomyxa filosa]|uniref:Lipase n=1 Tax=Reticulomyxa filosa TaxID=46433 RepID=X6NNM0_RETFI|nr:carboxylic ester hydrolase [Reticulomyxa filosa]|eukprot:ETO27304.1 carboxylic ester hydrolase [Reticulomyxa filosa]